MASNTQRVFLPGGQIAEFPADMPQAEIEKAVRAHLGVPEAKPATGPPDSIEPAPGSSEATMDMAGRVLNPGQPKGRDVVQRIGDAVLPPLVTAPAIVAGGEALPAAPVVGRALASGGLGAAKALSSGADALQAGKQALIDAMTGLVAEAIPALGSRVKIPFTDIPSLKTIGEKIPGARAGFEAGERRIRDAYDAIKDRLPAGKWMNVPTLSKQKITAKDAVEGLLKQRNEDYKQTLGEIVSEMNRLDIQHGVRGFRGPAPYAGAAFKGRAPEARFVYRGTPGERAATTALEASRNPATRAALQAEATPEIMPGTGITRGAVPAIEIGEHMGFEGLSRAVRR